MSFDEVAETIAGIVANKLEVYATKQKLYNLKTAARVMDSTPPALRGMIEDRTIPPSVVRRVKRRIYLDRVEFERWIDSRRYAI